MQFYPDRRNECCYSFQAFFLEGEQVHLEHPWYLKHYNERRELHPPIHKEIQQLLCSRFQCKPETDYLKVNLLISAASFPVLRQRRMASNGVEHKGLMSMAFLLQRKSLSISLQHWFIIENKNADKAMHLIIL